MSMERWIAGMRAKGDPDAVKAGEELRRKHGDIAPAETKPLIPEFRLFTDQERKIFEDHGISTLLLGKETVEQQIAEKKPFEDVQSVLAKGERILKKFSMEGEVAFYSDPTNFFIPGSNNKSVFEQEELVKEDSEALRERLGLKESGLEIIIPAEVSTFTQMIFRYKDNKGIWLFRSGNECRYGRTKNALDEFGINFADVGADPQDGVDINSGRVDEGNPEIYVVRLIVARKK